jgi:hypothetical protein
MGSPADLAAIEGRLQAILEPYRSLLEPATIYGIPTLRRSGAKAHEWFAFVKPASKHVSFFLMPIVTWPDLLSGCSPSLAHARKAKSAFTFTSLDEALATDLEALVARSYLRYVGA